MTMSAPELQRLISRRQAALARAEECRRAGRNREAETQRAIVSALRRMLRTERSLEDLWEENLQQAQRMGRRRGRSSAGQVKQEAARLAWEREGLRVLRAEAEAARARHEPDDEWGPYELEPEPDRTLTVGPEEAVVMARHGWRPTVSGGLPGLGRRQ
ncbi:hypothetical protein AB0O57_29395 [Streptomyces sp. NPDC091201]|uniref:hypothetical protein n=1 Tax=Streptomyces sp. NPDC091201 TaxID=3155190 RepID=UPI003415B54E